MTRLRVVPMALGLGVTWGMGIMLLGWISASGWGARFVDVLSSLYLGYSSTFAGGVIGGLWAFGDAFLGGLVLALLYNALAGRGRAEKAAGFSRSAQPAH
ncbi:MAG: bacteriophage holin [Acidobacteriota bacterium]